MPGDAAACSAVRQAARRSSARLARGAAPPAARPRPPRLPAAVFDGHGGYAAAEYLQQNLYRIFTRVLDQQGVAEGLEFSIDVPGLACPIAFTPVLTDSFKHADEDLLSWMHGGWGVRELEG